MKIRYSFYSYHIFPRTRAQHCNYPTLLAGRVVCLLLVYSSIFSLCPSLGLVSCLDRISFRSQSSPCRCCTLKRDLQYYILLIITPLVSKVA